MYYEHDYTPTNELIDFLNARVKALEEENEELKKTLKETNDIPGFEGTLAALDELTIIKQRLILDYIIFIITFTTAIYLTYKTFKDENKK